MRRAALIPATWLADQIVGDPEGWPHPVRWMGWAISLGERILLRDDDKVLRKLFTGAVLSSTVVGLSYWAARELMRLVPWLEVPLAATTLAARNLDDEAAAVLDAPELTSARLQLARIVGRDTKSLGASEVARALIETLAESTSDGVVAPLFYLAVGGVPLAMAYKAVNTLDSMIGHLDERYRYFGRFAARLDDCANYLPARLSALAIIAAARSQEALTVWRESGGRHRSPNAGQPEAAMAGALGVRLGGDNRYAGELVRGQVIAPHLRRPTVADATKARRLAAAATLVAVAGATLLTLTIRRQRAR